MAFDICTARSGHPPIPPIGKALCALVCGSGNLNPLYSFGTHGAAWVNFGWVVVFGSRFLLLLLLAFCFVLAGG